MLTEYDTHEMSTLKERTPWNALKFGTTGEVNSQEGGTHAEGSELAPTKCGEVVAPQEELNGAESPWWSLQPYLQRLRTKLIFDPGRALFAPRANWELKWHFCS